MRGGVPAVSLGDGGSTRSLLQLVSALNARSQITLPAGYLGSSLIGAALIACGFDINASKM